MSRQRPSGPVAALVAFNRPRVCLVALLRGRRRARGRRDTATRPNTDVRGWEADMIIELGAGKFQGGANSQEPGQPAA